MVDPAPLPASSPGLSSDERARRISALMRDARTANARQDLCSAVRLYDGVLLLDANHAQARQERQRALDLLEKLRKQHSRLEC